MFFPTLIIGFFLGFKTLNLDSLTGTLSNILVRVLFPCLVFSTIVGHFSLHDLTTRAQIPIGAFLLVVFSFLCSLLLVRPYNNHHSSGTHTEMFACTFSNYIFLPLPISEILWGAEGRALVVLSTVGSEIALWTLGTWIFQRKIKLKYLLNPPMIAIALSFFCIIINTG